MAFLSNFCIALRQRTSFRRAVVLTSALLFSHSNVAWAQLDAPVRNAVEAQTENQNAIDHQTNSGAEASLRSESGVRSFRPSLESANIRPPAIDVQRERLFNELAEEFNTFDRLANLVRRVSHLVKPSVIHIEAHKTEEEAGSRQSYDEAGSGFLVELNGSQWVLTNRHVIHGSGLQEILLRTSDGHEFHPTRVIADASTDVAVMKVNVRDLPPSRMGDSDSVNIGDFVVAIGSPFGLSHSVTFGILSAKGRRDLSLGEQKIDMQDFFQTDAAINPGNSGGPLVNLRGEVVAMNTAIASSSGGSEGIGFAIPINMAVQVAQQLVEHGKLRRGYLGVTLDPDFSASKRTAFRFAYGGGALVKNVRAGSPAEGANMQKGDIIVQFNGRTVDNDDHLVAQVGLTPIGQPIPLIIYRDGKRYRTEVKLTNLP